MITITINTSRPGFVIGRSGEEVEKLRAELKKITKKEIQINIFEIKRAELEAQLVANELKRKIEGKMQYRKAIKMAIAATMRSRAEGIKIQISGRLNGAEMARSEMYKEGRTPLHTLRADIDYALAEALTKTGLLGIKVWICRGEIYGKKDLSPNVGASFEKKTYANHNFDRPYREREGGRDKNDRNKNDRKPFNKNKDRRNNQRNNKQ
jgi:small subunit ribosomal protein S3